ncbi:hypothetical protein [Deinococcus sp. UYEF24]
MRGPLGLVILLATGSALAATSLPAIPPDYFLRDSVPLNVKPTTDLDNSYSDTIGPEGGELTTLDAAGNTYILTVPKGALGFPQTLTMTPLNALKGMPFKGGLNAGVQLEPEGTYFVKPVTLEIAFDKPPDLNKITPFGYTGAGQDFTSTMLKPAPGHFIFVLNHFSGAGFANSTEAERTAELVQQPLDAAERISKYVQQVGEERQKQLLGQESSGEAAAAFARALAAYKEEVLEPLSEVAAQSCTAGTLYINLVLAVERQAQIMGASSDSALPGLASLMGGPIGLKCLEEEQQVCFTSGDLMRLAVFGLGMERQAQLLGGTLDDSFATKFAKAYSGCSHFEVQFNATLIQKGVVDLGAVFGGKGPVQGTGLTNYHAAVVGILPIRVPAVTGGRMLAVLASDVLPRGEQPLPYAGYTYSNTTNGQIAVAQTQDGTLGVKGACIETGTGTAPGLLAATFFPAFKPGPPRDPNAADPSLNGLTAAQKRTFLLISRHVERVGLLASPRVLDVPSSVLTIGVGVPSEHVRTACTDPEGNKTLDLTSWLDAWNTQLKVIGKAQVVALDKNISTEPGWDLRAWKPAIAFPLKLVQDVPKHEAIQGGTYDETWHLDITVVHTPSESP